MLGGVLGHDGEDDEVLVDADLLQDVLKPDNGSSLVVLVGVDEGR